MRQNSQIDLINVIHVRNCMENQLEKYLELDF